MSTKENRARAKNQQCWYSLIPAVPVLALSLYADNLSFISHYCDLYLDWQLYINLQNGIICGCLANFSQIFHRWWFFGGFCVRSRCHIKEVVDWGREVYIIYVPRSVVVLWVSSTPSLAPNGAQTSLVLLNYLHFFFLCLYFRVLLFFWCYKV